MCHQKLVKIKVQLGTLLKCHENPYFRIDISGRDVLGHVTSTLTCKLTDWKQKICYQRQKSNNHSRQQAICYYVVNKF